MKVLSYQVERTKDCVKINTKNWIQPDSNKVQRFRMSGRPVVTYITTALETNLSEKFKDTVQKGDTILLTRVVSDVSQYKSYSLEDDTEFYNVPAMQVIGKFKENIVDFEHLTLFNDKILFEKVSHNFSDTLYAPDEGTTIGRILKVGTCRFTKEWEKVDMTAKVGDTVLVKDNVTTKITLNGHEYQATEEGMVLGVFNSTTDLSLSNLSVINNAILMKPFKPSKVLNSKVLVMPELNEDSLDESDLFLSNQFEVVKVDHNVSNLKEHDIVFVNKDVTCYAFFEGTKYYVTNGIEYIEGKIIGNKV